MADITIQDCEELYKKFIEYTRGGKYREWVTLRSLETKLEDMRLNGWNAPQYAKQKLFKMVLKAIGENTTHTRREQMANKPWQNKSGYNDPTAYEATKPISEEEQRVAELMKVLKTIIRWAGFSLIDRIELQDRRSGRTYR